ncbi:MAG: glucan biosynthesis protein, partial [Nitrospira sp.]|nr:glucan biosynthesis protein [Nitrospira sp.]
DYFTFGGSSLGQTFPDDLGFSGFRLQEGPGATTDWMAFLGASYFRSAGELNQYGLSARGVAINPAL